MGLRYPGNVFRVVAVITGAMLVPMAAHATPPEQREKEETIQASTLRDDASDVVLSDGLGAYSARELAASSVRNFIPSIVDSDVNTVNQDRLFVRTAADGTRQMPLSSDLASAAHFGPGNTQAIGCASTHVLFESSSSPDWWEALVSPGDRVEGWGNVRCYTTPELDRGYQVFYSRPSATRGECLQITRTTSTALVLAAPAGNLLNAAGDPDCNATVQSFAYTTQADGTRSFSATFLGWESAPYEITLDFGHGKGKGH